MILKSQSCWGQKAHSMAIAWPVSPRAESLQIPDPAPSRTKKCGAICSVLQIWWGERGLHSPEAFSMLTVLDRPRFLLPTLVFHPARHPARGNQMQCSFMHFGHHQSCPQKAHTTRCSLGGVTKRGRAHEYPQTSPDWVCQPTSYYFRNFLKESGLQNHDDLMLRL